MKAAETTDALIAELETGRYRHARLNYANGDMVGHTGILGAAVKACETVDRCVRQIVERIAGMGGLAMITADHGNSEKMIDERGGAHTAHTLNPVPFILVDDTRRDADLRQGVLADIAPTILDIMGIEKPPQMTGTSLLGRTQK